MAKEQLLLSRMQARSSLDHTGKDLRLWVKTETESADEQAGFREGRRTRNQITNFRILMDKPREHQQPPYMCFVDFKKAFDSISHDKLWVTVMDAVSLFVPVKFNFCREKSATKFLCVKNSSGKIVATSFLYLTVHRWIAGDVPIYVKFALKWPTPSENADFAQ